METIASSQSLRRGSGVPDDFDRYVPPRPGAMRNAWRNIHSRHTGSIRILFPFCTLLFVILVLYGLYVAFSANPPMGVEKGNALTIIIGLAGAMLAVMWKVYDVGDLRRGAVDLFMYEIYNVCRVMTTMRVVSATILMFWDTRAGTCPEEARKEKYMAIYENQLGALGFLNQRAISQITAFYTLLKGSRDALGLAAAWDKLDASGRSQQEIDIVKKTTVIHTAYILFLCLEAAYFALEELIESEKEFVAHRPLLVRSMTEAFVFIKDAFSAPPLSSFLDPRASSLPEREAWLRAINPNYDEGRRDYEKARDLILRFRNKAAAD